MVCTGVERTGFGALVQYENVFSGQVPLTVCSVFGTVCPSQCSSRATKGALKTLASPQTAVSAAAGVCCWLSGGSSFLRDGFRARRASADVCGAVLSMTAVNQTQIFCVCWCVFVFV